MNRRRAASLALAAVLALTACSQGFAMGKMILFSAIQGTVLMTGKPVGGAKVERRYEWSWKNETGHDETTTDAAGHFSLPQITGRSMLSFLPHEAVIDQTITVRVNGKAYEAWLLFKRDYDENSELNGKPINVVCRLDAEPKRRGELFGLCEPA